MMGLGMNCLIVSLYLEPFLSHFLLGIHHVADPNKKTVMTLGKKPHNKNTCTHTTPFPKSIDFFSVEM